MIIGFKGRMGCGKSTAAAHLIEQHGFTCHKMAGPLKQMMRCIGLTDRHIEGDLKEVPCDLLGGKTPRQAMQTIGTDWGRDIIHQEIWVNAWEATLPAGLVVCDDVRFPNEAESVRKQGGIIIEIVRDDCEHVSDHQSEAMAFEADYIIQNNGTPEELRKKIALFLEDPKDLVETFYQ